MGSWFAYCMEEPGIVNEDFEELKTLLYSFWKLKESLNLAVNY